MKKEFYNLKYGKCKLLDKKKDLYLVYAENCELHYIVCIYIDNMGNPNIINFWIHSHVFCVSSFNIISPQ